MLEQFIGLFFLGIATFLAPCTIALISVYLTYAVGISKSIRRGLTIGCSFALAMCLVFFFLGYAISALIPIGLASYKTIFYGVSGVLLILFGINNMGLLEKAGLTTKTGSLLNKGVNAVKLNALTRFSGYNYALGSFSFGVVISLAVGPCSLSIILPAILLTMFTAPTPFHGGLLLFMYGLGHALPVVILSVLLATARKAVGSEFTNAGRWLKKVFGPAFVIIGIVIIAYVLIGW